MTIPAGCQRAAGYGSELIDRSSVDVCSRFADGRMRLGLGRDTKLGRRLWRGGQDGPWWHFVRCRRRSGWRCNGWRSESSGRHELWSRRGTAGAQPRRNLLTIDNLRYRLMPYVYSLAWKVTNEGYTMERDDGRAHDRCAGGQLHGDAHDEDVQRRRGRSEPRRGRRNHHGSGPDGPVQRLRRRREHTLTRRCGRRRRRKNQTRPGKPC